jgi:hypothetical protein
VITHDVFEYAPALGVFERLIAKGDQKQQPVLLHDRRHVRQHLERRAVGPMHVFQHDQLRAFRRAPFDQPEDAQHDHPPSALSSILPSGVAADGGVLV